MKDFKNIMVHRVGNPKVFVFLIIWLMVLVFFGTLAQRDQGLYLVQLDYFSSWIKWFGPLPTPSAKLTMLAMFINLSGFFFRPNILKLQKIGITITHTGIMLMLIGSGLTSIFSTEGNMIIDEGEKSNFFENYYVKEFVIINKTNSGTVFQNTNDWGIATSQFKTLQDQGLVPKQYSSFGDLISERKKHKKGSTKYDAVNIIINSAYGRSGVLTSIRFDDYIIFDEPLLHKNSFLEAPDLPFKIEVIDYYVNCNPIQKQDDQFKNDFYKGMARNFYLQEIPSEKEYEKNRPGIIYEIIASGDIDIDGIYILFMGQPVPQLINIENSHFEFKLRPYRTYLPFEIELVDFKKEMHPGTDVAKSYSSEINLVEDGVSRKSIIEMNAPFRHYDYTFYQASFIEQNEIQTTVLATVKNYGRIFPYVSTIIMCIGILFHMLVMVSRRFKK